MIDSNFASNYLPVVGNFILGKSIEKKTESSDPTIRHSANNGILCARKIQKSGPGYFVSDYGSYSSPEDAPEDSIAIIEVNGVITKYDQDCGPSGMKTKTNLLNRCYNNPNIKGIVLSIDSGGGEGMACLMMQETIANRNKGVCAFVQDFAASAAYGIAAACDTITVNSKLAEIGSIGTYCTIIDYTKYYRKMGINLIEVYASKSKDKNSDYYEAIKGNVEPLRKRCDIFNDHFISSIAQFREGRISTDQEKWNTGKLFFAEEAIQLGLADQIGTLEDVINYFNT
jgi:signal peptide peptidase SppA